MPLESQIPLWFWAVLSVGALALVGTLAGLTSALIKYVINRNQSQLNDMQGSVIETNRSVKTVSENVNELSSMIRLHDYKLSDHGRDIEKLQEQMSGPFPVK